MKAKFLVQIVVSSAAAIVGSWVGMNNYLDGVAERYRVTPDVYEQSGYIAIAHCGVGAALAVTISLCGVSITMRDKSRSEQERQALKRFAQSRLKSGSLTPQQSQFWIEVMSEVSHDG